MESLLPLPIAVPLVAAAALAATAHLLPPRAADVLAIAATIASGAASAALLAGARHPLLQWSGDWRPRHGVALGVALVGDRLAAGLALLAAALVAAALLYSWRYFEEPGGHFPALLLVLLAALAGFALSGDLFTMFVFLELMGVSAYALTAHRIEASSSLQGSLNFAVANSIGSFFVLFGIALVYARTGALNLAQIGAALAGRPADGLVVCAFSLLAAGFLVKAGIVPFHFWLADAYAAAPATVCAVMAGVMTEMGVYGVARVYWACFSGPLDAHAEALRAILVGAGVLTALTGGIMCTLQRNLKRMLAYSAVADSGVLLVGVGLLDGPALAGVALFLVAHGAAKSALFLAAGGLRHRFGSVDELRLHGRARSAPAAAGVYVACAVALAGPPLVGTYAGRSLIEEAARSAGMPWILAVLAAASALTCGTLLRAAARVFAGLGDAEDALLSEEPDEDVDAAERAPGPLLVAPAVALAALALAVSLVPGLEPSAEHGAAAFVDRAAYARQVLHGGAGHAAPAGSGLPRLSGSSAASGLAALAGAMAVAALGLYRRRLPAGLRRAAGPLGALAAALKALHSGHVGDYTALLCAGVAALGALCALTLR